MDPAAPHVKAPWTPDQVASLNGYQASEKYHPYTCRNRGASFHRWRLGDKGVLIPTTSGWICSDCDYTQDWAHAFTTSWAWRAQPMG